MTIYADNAATTKMSRAAIEAMMPYLADNFYNPSSLYSAGQRAKEARDVSAPKQRRSYLRRADLNPTIRLLSARRPPAQERENVIS